MDTKVSSADNTECKKQSGECYSSSGAPDLKKYVQVNTTCSMFVGGAGTCYRPKTAAELSSDANAAQQIDTLNNVPITSNPTPTPNPAPQTPTTTNPTPKTPTTNNPTPSSSSGTATTNTSPQSTSFTNPLQYNTVQDVLGGLLSALQGIIVILSIIFIVIGAVMYVTSGGNSKQIESAKSAITAAMIGLAIGIAAPSFLKEISGILGWNSAPADVSGAISLTQILTNVLTFLTGIVGILSIIMLIIGALMYLTSAGDEDRIDDGKKIVKYSIIGIIVAFAALVIVKQVAALFV